jgi:hypothetical protein
MVYCFYRTGKCPRLFQIQATTENEWFELDGLKIIGGC